MSILKQFKGYAKGFSIERKDNPTQSIETEEFDNKESTEEDMFSKNYWFSDQQEEEIKDPWLPQLVTNK